MYESYDVFCKHNVRAPTPDTRVNISSSLHVFHFCIIVLLFFVYVCVSIFACNVGKACLFCLTNKIFKFEFEIDIKQQLWFILINHSFIQSPILSFLWQPTRSRHILTEFSDPFVGHWNNAKHYNVIKWKHFPCYWPFVRGIHRAPVNSPRARWIPLTKASDAELWFFFLWSASEQTRGWWFETPSWLLWHHSNEIISIQKWSAGSRDIRRYSVCSRNWYRTDLRSLSVI